MPKKHQTSNLPPQNPHEHTHLDPADWVQMILCERNVATATMRLSLLQSERRNAELTRHLQDQKHQADVRELEAQVMNARARQQSLVDDLNARYRVDLKSKAIVPETGEIVDLPTEPNA